MVYNHINRGNKPLAKIKINPIIFSNYILFCFLFKLLKYFITFRPRKLLIFKHLITIKTTSMVSKTTYMVLKTTFMVLKTTYMVS